MRSGRVPHPVCHMLYIFMSTCNVCFHALVPTFYFILCSRSGLPIRCVICIIFSSPQWMCSFLPWVPCFILSCAVEVRPHPVCHMFYIVISNCDVFLNSLYYVFRLFCSSPDLECSFNHTDKMYNHKLFKISLHPIAVTSDNSN